MLQLQARCHPRCARFCRRCHRVQRSSSPDCAVVVGPPSSSSPLLDSPRRVLRGAHLFVPGASPDRCCHRPPLFWLPPPSSISPPVSHLAIVVRITSRPSSSSSDPLPSHCLSIAVVPRRRRRSSSPPIVIASSFSSLSSRPVRSIVFPSPSPPPCPLDLHRASLLRRSRRAPELHFRHCRCHALVAPPPLPKGST